MILFRHKLGGVQNVEGQGVGLFLAEQLHAELPLGEVALVDGLIQVAAVIVGVGAGDLDRLVPAGRLRAQLGPPVEFHQRRHALGVQQAEGVDAEPLHHPQAARNAPIRHGPHDHVGAFRHQADEIPEGVVGAGRLGIAPVRLHLHRMDQVREFDRVLNEEDRDVVADQIPVAFGRIEFDREAAHVARRIHRTGPARDGREAGEQFGLLAHFGQNLGGGEVRQAFGQFEEAVGGRTARMDDPLGDALMVEMLDLLAEDEVLQQGRAARAGLERVLIVADRRAVVGGGAGLGRRGGLVQFAAVAQRGRGGARRGLGHLKTFWEAGDHGAWRASPC